MNPERFTNPFIVYWDIDPVMFDNDIALRICDELVETRIFVLNLRDISPTLNKGTVSVLKRLCNEQIKINLTATSTVLEESTMNIMKDPGIATLYIESDSLEDCRSSLPVIMNAVDQGIATGVSFYISESNIRELPAILSTCIENNIKDLKFPIHRADSGNIFYLDSETALWLSKELKKLPLELLQLTIHDPMMWELFHGKDNPNEEGCNGAKTMIYISGDFDVTPCPILPVPIGNLCFVTLKDIFSSEKRRGVRTELSHPPQECSSCAVISTCKGGCRGRAYVLFKSFNKRDPACLLDLQFNENH
jgi:GeoRSP system SPASM domain protein